MKKLIYLSVLLFTLVIGVNKVNADTYYSYASTWYQDYTYQSSLDTDYSTIVDNLITYYNNNFSTDYPYYWILYVNPQMTNYFQVQLVASTTNEFYSPKAQSNAAICPNTTNDNIVSYTYDKHNNNYFSTLDTQSSFCFGSIPYTSNTNLIFKAKSGNADVLTLPSYSDLAEDIAYPLQDIADGEIIPTYTSLLNGPTAGYIEVDLSDYAYIILSLKNYDTSPFNTTIYTLGRLCLTSVWDYGMTPKSDYFTGYQAEGCTDYYNSTTPVSIFIIQGDIDNHGVFYIKQYQNETDIVRIPTSIFDITYITQEDASNPNVVINGRSYPTIPFSELPDTANKSTDEGYISGRVCAIGDVNCVAEVSGIEIDDLFTNPLKLLKSIWGSITGVLSVISTFITILPPTLQAFLYTAFILGLVIAIIKIIL